jgi:hypothetical protein
MDSVRTAYMRATGGPLYGRPRTGSESKHPARLTLVFGKTGNTNTAQRFFENLRAADDLDGIDVLIRDLRRETDVQGTFHVLDYVRELRGNNTRVKRLETPLEPGVPHSKRADIELEDGQLLELRNWTSCGTSPDPLDPNFRDNCESFANLLRD